MALTLGINAEPGTLNVARVDYGALAHSAGIRAGDSITEINGSQVRNSTEARAALSAAEEVGTVNFVVTRAGQSVRLVPVDLNAARVAAPPATQSVNSTSPLGRELLDRARSVEGLGGVIKGFGIFAIALSLFVAFLLFLVEAPDPDGYGKIHPYIPLAVGLAVGGALQGLLLTLVGSYTAMRAVATRYRLAQDGIV